MNRLKNILFYFLIIYLLTGCMKEDYSKCPPVNDYNLILWFEYFDHQQKDIFNGRINKIDVFIFDEDYSFHKHLILRKEDLSQFKGVKHKIDPGKYHIIAWANISELTNYSTSTNVETSFENSQLHHISETTIDPLHYAPDKRGVDKSQTTDYQFYEVEVKQNTITEHTLFFMSAHRTINMYVKGFNQTAELTAHINGLAAYYDYHLITRNSEIRNLKQNITSVSSLDEEFLYTSFYVPHFENENSIEVGITGKQGSGLADFIKLQDILQEQNIVVEDGDDRIIDILFTYEDGDLLQITLPDWEVRPSQPSFD